MHIVINIFVGIVAAWASQRQSSGMNGLGWWRFAAGAAAGAFSHIDQLFYIFGTGFGLYHQYAETWSLLLLPLYAFVIAFVFEKLAKGGQTPECPYVWKNFYPPILLTMIVVNILGALTQNGIMPLAPLFDWRLHLNLIYDFDLIIFTSSLLTVAVGVIFRRWWSIIGRVGLILIFGYLIAVSTFKLKASDVANTYANALDLTVTERNILPQPISPFNWRIIIETEGNRLHDTRINLYLDEEREVFHTSKRAGRVAATYKPIDKAIWRIYHRFGRTHREFAQAAWSSDMQDIFKWHGRFAVFRKVTAYQGVDCAEFKDLRFDGARFRHLGNYLLCPQGQGWSLYQAAEDGELVKLDLM